MLVRNVPTGAADRHGGHDLARPRGLPGHRGAAGALSLAAADDETSRRGGQADGVEAVVHRNRLALP